MEDLNTIMVTTEIDNLIKEMEDHITEIFKTEDHKGDMEEGHLMKKV